MTGPETLDQLPLVVLELGSYVAPAHAGRLLMEQGWQVEKWVAGPGRDPIEGLREGTRLWRWFTEGKKLIEQSSGQIWQLAPGWVDAVVDNHTPAAWERWGISPDWEARRLGVPWVSIVADVPDAQGGQRSFDAFAQARAFGEDCPPIPFYIGDTTAGLTAAFVLASMRAQGRIGRVVVPQAAALAKLREGDLACRPPEGGWDEPGTYGVAPDGALVVYRGKTYREPPRDDAWRRENLRHEHGTLLIGIPDQQ